MDNEALKEFFFEAALATYAGGGPKMPQEQLPPGFKGYKYSRGRYLYLDRYAVGQKGKSFGDTVICQDDQPVWFMHYYGFCHDKAASELVKRAMREAYAEKKFCGGRGIKGVQDGNLRYGNSSTEFFPQFGGEDWVSDLTDGKDSLAFYHWYNGGLISK